jgi:hypothetical protein
MFPLCPALASASSSNSLDNTVAVVASFRATSAASRRNPEQQRLGAAVQNQKQKKLKIAVFLGLHTDRHPARQRHGCQ